MRHPLSLSGLISEGEKMEEHGQCRPTQSTFPGIHGLASESDGLACDFSKVSKDEPSQKHPRETKD